MHLFTASLSEYKRLPTKEVKVGDLLIGNFNPVRLQTMTTTDTMDTAATIAESIRCIEAGAELVRITAPSKKEAENLLHIKNGLKAKGYNTPLVADIHFTPNAAEIAARLIEKVRVNPGNYVDKKKFEQITYTDALYQEEIDRIRKRFTPLLKICKEYGTAMRIGTNHGSLSDRIMSRYGDTPIGMVESAMEFLRIARDENYHNIVLSMKASNPIVMVEAYRLLIQTMYDEFQEIYPLHLGVTEAGDGEDGRIKSAVGMGTLLEDGIGDTVRVSLTEAPELEIPVCRDLVKRYPNATQKITDFKPERKEIIHHFEINEVANIGGNHVPVVIADFSKQNTITPISLKQIGYDYDEKLDKWHINDLAADYIFTNGNAIDFALPGTLKIITTADDYQQYEAGKAFPIFEYSAFQIAENKSTIANFVMLDCHISKQKIEEQLRQLSNHKSVIICLSSESKNAMQEVRSALWQWEKIKAKNPIIIMVDSRLESPD